MVVNILFPISNVNIKGIELRNMTSDDKRKVSLIFAAFLIPVVIFLLVSNFTWVCKILAVLPAVLCYFLGTLFLFFPSRDNLKARINESASAAIYMLGFCYSFSTFYYYLLPPEVGNNIKEFWGVYLEFMLWSFVFILIGYRIHYRKNITATDKSQNSSGINWNIITVIGVVGCSFFLKLFSRNQRYAVGRAITFVAIILLFLMLSVGIFELRKIQFYIKSNSKE